MRLFWLMTLACFVWVSTHEAAAHAGVFSDPAGFANMRLDGHAGGPSKPGDGTDAEDDHGDHQDRDSHGHFRGAVDTPVKPVVKTAMVLATPVILGSIEIHLQEYLSLSPMRVFRLPAKEPPRYLSAQSLLL